MSGYSEEFKTGPAAPAYDEILPSRQGQDVRHASSRMPWWNPRYWRKGIWAAVILAFVVVLIIVIAVSVTKVKENRYPDYSPLSYSLADTYGGESFYDQFNYFTGYDPTQGFVHYVPREQAQALNLTSVSADSAFLRVDTSVDPNSEPNASTGRFSVRVVSKKTYDSGLFIFDIKHTPYGCGTWPALWLTDPSNWPENGEIDIMEATNKADTGNQMTLHTTKGCSMDVRRKSTGEILQKNCNHELNDNDGCGVRSNADGYGTGFNKNGEVSWLWNGERKVSACGSSPGTQFHPTSSQTNPLPVLGVLPSPISPVQTAILVLTSRTKVSLPTSTCAVVWCPMFGLTPGVLVTARASLLTIPRHSIMPTGSLVLSKCTKPSKPGYG
ncbi:hypothetical protein NXS19_009934 [Fusarium pseudograminearum]|nr:hypothetical protein NXS19_009934 [Fusarium pseudograminearum]